MNVAAFAPPPIDFADDLAVREAHAGDLEGLVEVERLTQSAPWPRSVFERELELDFSRAWVVDWREGGAAIAGFLVFWVVADEVHILDVAVHPGAQRRGIARKLLEALVGRAQEQHAAVISLEVRESNEAARALYKGLGFVEIGFRPHYYADNGEGAEVMALVLEG